MKPAFLFLVPALFFSSPAAADFSFEQDVRRTLTDVHEKSPGPIEELFRRKIHVFDQMFVIQIEEGGALKKEFGFNFEKNHYYEADPEKGYFKLFDLTVLDEAFRRMGRQAPERARNSRAGMARELSRGLVEGQADYPVRVRRALFAPKAFEGRPARLYKLRAGPGTAFLNLFGWYRKAEIWAAVDVPGFSEYTAARLRLAEKAGFYKIKHNKVSDLITALAVLDGVPLRIDSVSRHTDERATRRETSRAVTSLISTAPVRQGRLLYYKRQADFSWNVVFSKGTEFGPEASPNGSEPFQARRILPWLVVPVLFFIVTYLWFFGGYSEPRPLSLRRFLVLRTYIVLSALFGLQSAHYFFDWPYWISPLFEFSLATAAGAAWTGWGTFAEHRRIQNALHEARLRFCPHCNARIEDFYIECPNCNRAI